MKKCLIFILIFILCISLYACTEIDASTHLSAADDEGTKLSFIAEFYDNHGIEWLSVEGTSFNISPNKVKEYYYATDGSWISGYTTSSVVSIDIDGQNIETCGSTVLFYDTQLEKINIELPSDVALSQGDSASISSPSDIRWQDAWTLNWWWISKNLENDTCDRRIVIIQSQEGDPICMFMGNEVTWDVSRNLPKTTEICIDGKMIYIHRANYAIVDTSIFE